MPLYTFLHKLLNVLVHITKKKYFLETSVGFKRPTWRCIRGDGNSSLRELRVIIVYNGFAWVCSSTPKMEATCSSETLVDMRRTTLRYIPDGRTLRNQRSEDFKGLHVWVCLDVRGCHVANGLRARRTVPLESYLKLSGAPRLTLWTVREEIIFRVMRRGGATVFMF
jgi:hypothetical protein